MILDIEVPELEAFPQEFQETYWVCNDDQMELKIPDLSNGNYGAYTILWDDNSNGSTRLVTTSGNYELTLANQCEEKTYSFEVRFSGDAVRIPNTFTPNGDGINDSFYPIFLPGDIEVLKFQIFNRWGELVHQEHSPWDGAFKNTPQVADVFIYYYQIKTECGIIDKVGDVTLIR